MRLHCPLRIAISTVAPGYPATHHARCGEGEGDDGDGDSGDGAGWAADLDALHVRVALQFGRAEPRRRMRAYIGGLLTPVERKSG